MQIPSAPRLNDVEFDSWMEQFVEYVRLIFKGKLSEVATFTDGDTTPDVGDGNCFITANTGVTTITGFDNGTNGQLVQIIIGDVNTTIDFTGTNLEGNAGVDWTPTTNDHMTCISNGTNWFCAISDNTA